jgi:hypothetical protein
MSDASLSIEAIAHRFIDAFNRRDAESLVALSDPEIEFHPTLLVGGRRVYHGHDGLRRWVSELGVATVQHQVRVREVRALEADRLLVLSEVYLDGDLLSPAAMIATLSAEGRIVEAQAYLTDERLLTHLGLVPAGASDAAQPRDTGGWARL